MIETTQISPSVPSWLEMPPTSTVKPPTTTRIQLLPFGDLTWENFERLCLRLTKLENDVEHCQLYGLKGQDQEGIDIFARKTSSDLYSVYQCKRENNFTASKIKAAVKKFLSGDWSSKSERFVLCTKESLVEKKRADEVEVQTQLLKKQNIKFNIWDSEELSLKLKVLPELVDDFFGREWVRSFCGEDAVLRLGKRLDANQIIELRHRLQKFYNRVFLSHDPGLPTIDQINQEKSLPLEKRFVLPDIDNRQLSFEQEKSNDSESRSNDFDIPEEQYDKPYAKRRRHKKFKRRRTLSYDQRHKIENWLISNSRSVILGVPGSGKSTLLRFLILDLLQEEPQLQSIASKWGTYLPIWVPFAYWTKQIANIRTGDISLKETIQTWLKGWDEEDLWILVEQALNDKRLLLFVDGLDEYTDDNAGRIALFRLQNFVEQRNLPAIITSRPHGFEKLSLSMLGWEIGKLSSFSLIQQEKLARIWFSHWLSVIDSNATSSEEIERVIDKKVDDFKNDLHKSGDLQELAKTPLLLSLLIAYKLHNFQLPQNRFKAYDSLVQHLITVHPQQRKVAASLLTTASDITDDDLKVVLARLAFKIHNSYTEGIINQKEAFKIVYDFLRDDEAGGFGLESAQARKISHEVLEISENTLGILVQKSQNDIGFFHRALQEYLTAYYISTMDFTDQLRIVEERCIDPQWHEVILGLFSLTNRAEDIKSIIEKVKNRNVNFAEKFSIDLLLSEVVFGDFKINVSLARQLAEEYFTKIEVGTFLEYRENLLNNAIDGLRSTKVKELVKEKIFDWFPDTTKWSREGVFFEMANWRFSSDVVECLWKNLYDEYPSNQRAAAKALAKIANNDEKIGQRVADLAWSEVDPNLRAVAIECLLYGWSQHKDLEKILQHARKSLHPSLRLIAIFGRVSRGKKTSSDLKELFYLSSHKAGLDYYWDDKVSETIVKGWLKSLEVKRRCLDATGIDRYKRQENKDNPIIEEHIAEAILLSGFPQDDEVAEHFAQEITKPYFNPYSLLRYDSEKKFFKLLEQNFNDHPIIINAIDKYLSQSDQHYRIEFQMALVTRTPFAKEKMLSLLDSDNPYSAPSTLLDGWGMQDSDVRKKLLTLIDEDSEKLSKISDLLPKIIDKQKECRALLLKIIKNPKVSSISRAVNALAQLDKNAINNEIIDIVLSKVKEDGFYNSGISTLIELGVPNNEVRKIALEQFTKPYSDLSTIAKGYEHDGEIKKRLIKSVTPLVSDLRLTIATQLGEGVEGDDFALSVLENYKFDRDIDVATQASINYHKRLNNKELNIQHITENLISDAKSRELIHDQSVYTSFCGLTVLKQLEKLPTNFSDKNRSPQEDFIRIPIGESTFDSPVPIHKLLLENWSYIKQVFGEAFFRRFASNSYGSSKLAFWTELCPFLDEYSIPRKEAITFFEKNKESNEFISSEVLSFLGRIMPKSSLLLDYCMKALGESGKDSWYLQENAFLAAEILAKQFTDNENAFHRVINLNLETVNKTPSEKKIPENYVLALSEAWVNSEEFKLMVEEIFKKRQPLSYPVFFQLVSRAYPPDILFKELQSFIIKAEQDSLLQHKMVVRALIRRTRSDEEFYQLLIKRLTEGATASEKASFSKLVAFSRGTLEIRKWCIEEIENQVSGKTPPEIGLDLFKKDLHPIVNSLLEVIEFNVNRL
ncbi:MAG: NACHT domain-containing protein [Pyrinomonadaceae bacterium]